MSMIHNTQEHSPTVLIVDDMQENLILLSNILHDNYQLKIAKNGKKALQIIENSTIDLVLLDIVMPELDGYEVCKTLQSKESTKDIPIVFVTANTSVDDEKKGFELGAVDYITKPFSPTTVKARVKTHLSLYLQNRELQEQIQKNRHKDMLLQQQARLAALGEMIGNIAHQWRQPLSVITTTISGLKLKSEYGKLDESDIAQTNDIILNNADFLSKTIDNFRSFFRKDQPKENFNVAKAIEESVTIIQATYQNHYIDLSLDLAKDIDYYGSKNLLSQVFLNLFSNAKDALVSSNIQNKQVCVKLYKHKEITCIDIGDNAGGVADDIKSKVFDPYFTTKHQSQGTGLGLYMSKMIIQNHFDGSLRVDDSYYFRQKGACFEIKIDTKKPSELL